MTFKEFKKEVIYFCKKLQNEPTPKGCSLIVSYYDGIKASGYLKATETKAVHDNLKSLFEQNPQMLDIALGVITELKFKNQ